MFRLRSSTKEEGGTLDVHTQELRGSARHLGGHGGRSRRARRRQRGRGVSVTGDDGNPIALGGTLNIRNMSPMLGLSSTASDHFNLSVTGPGGAKVASRSFCFTNSTTASKPVDYIGNGVYTVTIANFSSNTCTGAPTARRACRSPSRRPLPSRRPPPRS